MLCYLGDEDLQTIFLGADIFGGIDHRPCRAAAVQLGRGNKNTTLVQTHHSVRQTAGNIRRNIIIIAAYSGSKVRAEETRRGTPGGVSSAGLLT